MTATEVVETEGPSSGASVETWVMHAGWLRRIFVPLFWAAVGLFATALAHGGGVREVEPWTIGVPAFIGVWQTYVAWRWKAQVRPDGIQVRDLFRSRFISFDSIEKVTFDAEDWRVFVVVPAGRRALLKLRGPRGGVALHSGYARFRKRLPALLEQVSDVVARRWFARLSQGETIRLSRRLVLSFDHVLVKGLLWGRREVAWADIRLVFTEGRCIISTPQRTLLNYSVAQTANLLVLPRMLQFMLGEADPHPRAPVEEAQVDGMPAEAVTDDMLSAEDGLLPDGQLAASDAQVAEAMTALEAVVAAQPAATPLAAATRDPGVSVSISPEAQATVQLQQGVDWLETAADQVGTDGAAKGRR